jgi:hypothetical protein
MSRQIPQTEVPGFGADLPIFISGHSLGGCVVLNCLQQQVGLAAINSETLQQLQQLYWLRITIGAVQGRASMLGHRRLMKQRSTWQACWLAFIGWRSWTALAPAQAALYRGAVLLAPMVSLEKASRAGLNPYLL